MKISEGATMTNPAVNPTGEILRLDFDRRLMLREATLGRE